MAKGKRGRPKIPAKDIRKFQVRVCLSLEEYKAVKKAAAADDTSMSSLCRGIVLKHLGHKR